MLYRDFLDHYAEHLADESRAFDGVERALAALQAAGRQARGLHQQGHLAFAGSCSMRSRLSTYFHAVCGRDAFAFFKPDARHLTATIEEAGGSPTRAIMIGDSRTDLETARNAAMPSICVDFGYTDVPAAQLGADRVISHFDDLAEAVAALAGARLRLGERRRLTRTGATRPRNIAARSRRRVGKDADRRGARRSLGDKPP